MVLNRFVLMELILNLVRFTALFVHRAVFVKVKVYQRQLFVEMVSFQLLALLLVQVAS